MSQKSIVIIGAGMAGLSAGCYGRLEGYETTILEQDARPGGLATCWRRGEYTINGGLAFIVGTAPGTGFHKIWRDLGVVPGLRMADCDHLMIVEGAGGREFRFHANIDTLHAHMLELAPEDREAIDGFIGATRVFLRYQLPVDKAPELLTPVDKIRLLGTSLPLLRMLGSWKKVTIGEFSRKLKSPFLREAFYEFKSLFSEDLPMAAVCLFAASAHRKAAGYPQGGAIALAQAVESRYLELGGEVRYRTRASRVLVENGRAVGVRLADGSEVRADFVISAADGRTTLFELLEGRFVDRRIRKIYAAFPVGPSPVMVALGVAREFPEVPHSALGLLFRLREPVSLAGSRVGWLRPMIYNYDPTLAPAGKTLVRVVVPSDYDFWSGLLAERYREEKEKTADLVVELLEQRFPGISALVEMRDVATPLTFERYTGNFRGSGIGWDLTPRTFMARIPKRLPGLRNFVMAGQWVEGGGGIPIVALSGRNAVQIIRRLDR
jgi:phytoene dehydrogenase-like protein